MGPVTRLLNRAGVNMCVNVRVHVAIGSTRESVDLHPQVGIATGIGIA
jgi:hypothetical protein